MGGMRKRWSISAVPVTLLDCGTILFQPIRKALEMLGNEKPASNDLTFTCRDVPARDLLKVINVVKVHAFQFASGALNIARDRDVNEE
jgi:hypothetical protein